VPELIGIYSAEKEIPVVLGRPGWDVLCYRDFDAIYDYKILRQRLFMPRPHQLP